MVISIRRAGVSIAAVILAIAGGSLSAQQQPQQPPTPSSDAKPSSKAHVMTLRGCLQGTMLDNIAPQKDTLSAPPQVRLSANRATRSQLKEHNGALVELTGTLKGGDKVGGGKVIKDTGKTKIYVGGTERDVNHPTIDSPDSEIVPTFDVTSVTVIAPACQTRS
jgi:hypothetical protein